MWTITILELLQTEVLSLGHYAPMTSVLSRIKIWVLHYKMKELIGYLFSGLPRYRELNETSHPLCRTSCNEILGHLPDGKTVREFVDYYHDTMNETQENDTTFKNEQVTFAYMGVTYDFGKGIWLNDFDGSPFNDSLWWSFSLGC